LEQTKNFKKIQEDGGLTFHKDIRRSDFLVEFEEWNEKFGKGIVIEIYNSESIKSIEEKQTDWNNAHYSFIALDINSFNLDTENLSKSIKLKLKDYHSAYKELKVNEMIEKCNNTVNKITEKCNNTLENIKSKQHLFEFDFENFKKEFADLINGYNIETENELKKLKDQIENFRSSLDEQQNLFIKFQDKKEQLLNATLDNLKVELLHRANEMTNYVENHFKTKINPAKVLAEIDKKMELSIDFKNKLDKTIFNSCEKNRSQCFNIIKMKANDYFDNKIREIEKNGSSNSD